MVPMEDDIEWAVKRLRNHSSWGPSGMRADHVKGWLADARNKEKEEAAAAQKSAVERTVVVLRETVWGTERSLLTMRGSRV